MSSKTFIWFGMLVGSIIGGYIPTLFGLSFLSFTSIIASGIGALLGIYIAYKISNG